LIGDELRVPIMWCEMGSCISWHTDPAALGEVDLRARAINAGWRVDALGRLACSHCVQTDASFWATNQVVPWDRYTAIARAAAVSNDRTAAAWGSSRDRRRTVNSHLYTGMPDPRWHQPTPLLPRLSP
jgi:hypothetical protein